MIKRCTASPANTLLLLGITVLISAFLSACDSQSTFMSYDDRVKNGMRDVNYDDGISREEAKSIANAYLYLHGRYKGRASFARITELESEWHGKVLIVKSAATPVDVNLAPVVIDKVTGEVSWKNGPSLAKIDLEELNNKERSYTEK